MSEDTIWCNARVKLHNRKTDERDSVEKREFLAKRNHKYSQSFHLNKFSDFSAIPLSDISSYTKILAEFDIFSLFKSGFQIRPIFDKVSFWFCRTLEFFP